MLKVNFANAPPLAIGQRSICTFGVFAYVGRIAQPSCQLRADEAKRYCSKTHNRAMLVLQHNRCNYYKLSRRKIAKSGFGLIDILFWNAHFFRTGKLKKTARSSGCPQREQCRFDLDTADRTLRS